MIKISTEFDKLDYTFNRSLSTVVTLPYDKDDVLLGVNELVNGYNFNSCVEKLQSNLMYLYSVSKLADPNLPIQYDGVIGTATDSGKHLDIGIKNFTPYTQGVAAYNIEDYSEMPYFYVADSDNNVHTIVFSYEGAVNPDTTDGTIPSGTTTTIEMDLAQYGNDYAAVYGARQALSAYFGVNTYLYNEIYGGLNSNPVMELSSFNIGGMFFGDADYAAIASLFSDEPYTLNYQKGSTVELFRLFKNTNTQDLWETTIDKNFNNLKSISVGPGTLSGYNCVFCCSPDHISALSANTTSTLSADYTFTNVTSSIGINNDLNFQGINASVYAKNTLYVSDSTNNSVYKINVNGFTRDDNIRNNNFYETEIIGGLGGVRDNYSFNNPKILQYHNDELYVLDQGNNCIKIYDQDLGFVRNLRKTAFTKNNPPATIKMYDNNFYWLTTTGILFILDDDLTPLKSTKLYNDSNSEEFIDFIVAKDNNNLYVSTRENIYKYFFDNLEFIGRFNLSDNKIDNTSIEFLSQINVGDDTNKIYAYAKRNDFGGLLVFNEKNAFETLLSNYTFDIYSLDEIKVDKNEFVSNFSYNKSIIKLLSNNLQLSNYISNTVSVTLLRDGGIQFDGITYFNDSELKLLNYDPTLDNYIGTNEIFSRTVANRVLNKIYEYQLLLVKLFSNQVTPPQQQVNILSPGLRGLMLEDFPGNVNGYYRLEEGEFKDQPDYEPSNRDAILLEDSILEQKEVVIPPPAAEPEPEPIIIPCPTAKSPNSDEDMFSVGGCSPPLDLIVPFMDGLPLNYFFHPESFKLATFYGGFVNGVSSPNDEDNYLNYHILYTGVKTYKAINQNNKLTSDITFVMYRVPIATSRQNIGAWDYVAEDRTSLNYNLSLIRESIKAGESYGNFNCFEKKDFVVYFKFEKMDEEPDAFFNNTKSEEYRLKFEEGDPDYFGNVYDVNGCHLYKLINGGQKVDNTDKEDIEGGETIPVVKELICSDVSWEYVSDIVRAWYEIPGQPHYFNDIIYNNSPPNGWTTMTRAAEHNECYIVPGDWRVLMKTLDRWT